METTIYKKMKQAFSNMNEIIYFEDLRLTLEISDTSAFQVYLKELYKDLSDREESNKGQGISKLTFWAYIKLPVFISEKLFYALDCDDDGYLNQKEFTTGLFKLYIGTFEEAVEIVFNILDFDKDGWIKKGDARILLPYLPVKSDDLKDNQHQYKCQMDSLIEIDEILDQTFGNKNDKLNLNDFSSAIKNTKSDIFLQLICFLYLNKPFNKQNVDNYKNCRRNSPLSINIAYSNSSPQTNSPKVTVKKNAMPSPSRKSCLQPVESFLKISLEYDSENEDVQVDLNSPEKKLLLGSLKIISPPKKNSDKKKSTKFEDMSLVRMDNTKVIEIKKEIGVNDLKEIIKTSVSIVDSPSVYLKKSHVKFSSFSLENNLIHLEDDTNGNNNSLNISNYNSNNSPGYGSVNNSPRSLNNSQNNSPRANGSVSTSKFANNSPVKKNSFFKKAACDFTYENWVYKISDNTKIKKYYLKVIGKDIYYYKSDTKEELLGMHNLSGCFLKENGITNFQGKQFSSFSIIFSSKTRKYFIIDVEEMKNWVSILKKSIGYLSFFDFYEIDSDLGEGKFGMVKLGIHKKTSEKVAIKIIKKDTMTTSDMELVRYEIDIMKLCKHPNVVRLLDHFENSDYIFIVMEYLQGGDLSQFLIKKEFNFTERECGNIISQICQGIKYIHEFGIVHRDLKPENIMLTDVNGKGVFKVMDFGLSKILGPLEKAVDGFGTLSFVAPEVLVRQPYNKQIDIWSIGVILYLMVSGNLPFDDEADNEEIIAKLVVYSHLEFPEKEFKGMSSELKDFISNCMIKDPVKRFTIEMLLNHEWLLKYGKL